MTDQDVAPPLPALPEPIAADLFASVAEVAERVLATCAPGAGTVLLSRPDPHHGWGVSLEPLRSDAARVHVDALDGELVLTVGRAWTPLEVRDPGALLAQLEGVLTGVLTGRAEETVDGSPRARVTTPEGVVVLGDGWCPWRARRRRSWSAYAPA